MVLDLLLFWRPRLLKRDQAALIRERMDWLIERFSLEKPLEGAVTVLPQPPYFRFDLEDAPAEDVETDEKAADKAEGVEIAAKDRKAILLARGLFRQTAAYCMLSHWSVWLEPYDRSGRQKLGRYHFLRPAAKGSLRQFQPDPHRGAVIRYGVDLADTPEALIAVFAHEIAHQILSGVNLPDDVEADASGAQREMLTDLGGVFLGFGVFLCNSAHALIGHASYGDKGWSRNRVFTPDPAGLLYATALMLVWKGERQDAVLEALKPELRKPFKKAYAQARREAGSRKGGGSGEADGADEA